jgi:hypothetical protein
VINVTPAFLPGLELSRALYTEAVRPLLDAHHPGLPHAAARIGSGSEVLGLDTPRSVDHDWGPRLELFLAPADVTRLGSALDDLFRTRLPTRIEGWPTNFVPPTGRIRTMAETDGPVAHRIEITSLGPWLADRLGFDPRAGVTTADWLATPWQRLAEITGGAVYHDGIGELTDVRRRLRWYPADVWRYVLAAVWQRIGQEEAFVGRTAEVGDDLGSRMLAARQVRELMRLGLLLDRRYPPYHKWLGSALAHVPSAQPLLPHLAAALAAADGAGRQAALCRAYEATARWQNATGLADPVEPTVRGYFDRPFLVLDAGRFATALLARITDRALRTGPLTGSIDGYVDSTDLLVDPALARRLAAAVVPDGE